MSTTTAKALTLATVALSAVALTSCSNPDAPSARTPDATTTSAPQNPGEPTAPRAPSADLQAPSPVSRTPQAALITFARLYINWSYKTIGTQQRMLATMSVGAARLAEQQAATSSQADTSITLGQIRNSGSIISVAPKESQPRTWVIVTREQTGGASQYEGLPAAYHVTLAELAHLPSGYAVSQWLPQT